MKEITSNIIDSNTLIAEFMGCRYTNYFNGKTGIILNDPPDVYLPSNGVNGLKYNTSWHWLMPVISKCTKIVDRGVTQLTLGNRNPAEDFKIRNFFMSSITTEILTNDIDKTFNTVVEFIKWYNKQANETKKEEKN